MRVGAAVRRTPGSLARPGAPAAVVSAVPTWKTQTPFGAVLPSRVRIPVMPNVLVAL